MITSPRGFTLLVAIIFASVVLAIGIAVTDVAVKQSKIGISAKASQTAFYNADAGLECALYWDQKQDAFDYSTPNTTVECQNQQMTVTANAPVSNQREYTFSLPCAGDPDESLFTITVYKHSDGSAELYSEGTSCIAGNVVIRGIRADYGCYATDTCS